MSSPTHQQRKTSAPSAGQSPQWFHRLWDGGGTPAIRWRSLIGGVLALFLSNIVFTVGLAAIRWSMPLRLVGIVCLFLTAGGIFLGVRALIKVVVQLGLKRLLVFLVVLYLTTVIVVGLVVQTDEQGVGHWFASAGSVASWVVGGIGNLGRAALQTPDTVSFAATGGRQPIKVSGVEWIGGVPPTPIVVPAPSGGDAEVAVPPPPSSQVEQPGPASESDGRVWQVGDTVRVVKTEGAPLRARTAPATDAQVVVRFPSDSMLEIVDGPQNADGYMWWKVRGKSGEGWCAADFLALDETPH